MQPPVLVSSASSLGIQQELFGWFAPRARTRLHASLKKSNFPDEFDVKAFSGSESVAFHPDYGFI